MNCILLLTMITLNASEENNTLPRSWQVDQYKTEQACTDANKFRDNFNKWTQFIDEQGTKQSKAECVCFGKSKK